jgi:hypothetical protein
MTTSKLTWAFPRRFGCGVSEAVVLQLGNGQQVRFLQCGVGPDVVLIHGTLVTLEDPVIALMEELSADHRVTACQSASNFAPRSASFHAGSHGRSTALGTA